jgi:hypothetical protein
MTLRMCAAQLYGFVWRGHMRCSDCSLLSAACMANSG